MRHQTAAGTPDAVSQLTGDGTELLRAAALRPHCFAVTGDVQPAQLPYLAYFLTSTLLPEEDPT